MLKSIKVIGLLILFGLLIGPALFAQEGEAEEPQAAGNALIWKWISAAIAVGFSTIAGGLAVGKVGAAAMAAMGENPDVAGKALPYVGLAEGICLWGFIVALMILFS